MENQYGINNLITAVNALGEFATVIAKANTGSLWDRIAAFGQLADEVTALMAMDFGQLSKEWADRTPGENEQLKIIFKQKFDLKNDDIEALIEEAFGLVLETSKSFKMIYDFGLKLIRQAK